MSHDMTPERASAPHDQMPPAPDQPAPQTTMGTGQIRLRLLAAIVAIGCGVAALLVAILLVRGVLA